MLIILFWVLVTHNSFPNWHKNSKFLQLCKFSIFFILLWNRFNSIRLANLSKFSIVWLWLNDKFIAINFVNSLTFLMCDISLKNRSECFNFCSCVIFSISVTFLWDRSNYSFIVKCFKFVYLFSIIMILMYNSQSQMLNDVILLLRGNAVLCSGYIKM